MKKHTKNLKRLSAIICILTLIFSTVTIGTGSASAVSGKIDYTFKGDEKSKAGYAEGTISLSGVANGTYYLYWADDKNALEGYYEIAEVQVKNGNGSFSFGEHNAIPADATKLIATISKKNTAVGDAAAVYEIPKNKQLKYSSKDANYTFMSYSDIHIDKAESTYYPYAEEHWAKALETAASRNADFIITSGDNINNADGPGAEFDKYQEILSDSNYTNPIYEASGNHELRTGNNETLLNTFITATGLDGNPDTISKNKPYYYIEEPTSGDLFIFMALEYKYSPNEGDEFSNEQLDWLKNLLKENYGKNKNIYLIQHALIEGYGAGDDPDNYYTVPLNTEHKTTVEFRNIIESYPDIIWISGHTHIAFKYGYNYSNMNDTSCNMIHNSSVCCPTMLNYNSHNLSYSARDGEEYEDFTEGYYVQVFDNEVIFNGENLYHDKIFPTVCYIVESGRSSFTPEAVSDAAITSSTGVTFASAQQIETYVAQVLTIPKSLNSKNITAKDIESLNNKAENLLSSLYTFSSYNSYQSLKKASFESKTASEDYNSAYQKLSDAYLNAYPLTREGYVTVYFTDTKDWGDVYAKLWSSKNNNGDIGEKMAYVGENEENQKIYKIDVNYHQYNQVRFTNGTEDAVTEDQTLSGENNKLYTANAADMTSPYYCFTGTYENISEK